MLISHVAVDRPFRIGLTFGYRHQELAPVTIVASGDIDKLPHTATYLEVKIADHSRDHMPLMNSGTTVFGIESSGGAIAA